MAPWPSQAHWPPFPALEPLGSALCEFPTPTLPFQCFRGRCVSCEVHAGESEPSLRVSLPQAVVTQPPAGGFECLGGAGSPDFPAPCMPLGSWLSLQSGWAGLPRSEAKGRLFPADQRGHGALGMGSWVLPGAYIIPSAQPATF